VNASGPLLALLVLFWALVLLPVWVRRHQDALAERSAENFSRAMRVLARRTADEDVASPSHDLTPDAADSATDPVDLSRRPVAAAPAGTPQHVRVRRARVLLALVLLVVVTLLLVAVTPLPRLAAVPALGLLGLYVAALRAAARAQDGRSRTHRSAAGPGGERLHRRTERAGAGAADARPAADGAAYDGVAAESRIGTALFDAEAPVGAPDVIDLRDESGGHWDPRETPLPTYVRKNALHRRRIALGRSEPWTAEAATAPESPASPWSTPAPASEPRVAEPARPVAAPTAGHPGVETTVPEVDDATTPERRRAVND
jgi:hypothetical protein